MSDKAFAKTFHELT